MRFSTERLGFCLLPVFAAWRSFQRIKVLVKVELNTKLGSVPVKYPRASGDSLKAVIVC